MPASTTRLTIKPHLLFCSSRPVIFPSVHHISHGITCKRWVEMQASDPKLASRAPLGHARVSNHQSNTVAFEDVYKAHCGLVRRLCLRMLRDPTEAEDAAQDVFLCVLLKLHTFRGESALSSWLYRLTTNLVLMRLRKNSHKQDSQNMFLDDGSEPRGEIAKPDLYLNGAADRVDLQAAIDLLPDGTRAVFVLHEIQGYAHKEIAKQLGYSIGNSKSQLFKARRRLRTLLTASDDRETHGRCPAGSQEATRNGSTDDRPRRGDCPLPDIMWSRRLSF
jgi:RNA polymerase sigma-70 factor (ECF subfamily)